VHHWEPKRHPERVPVPCDSEVAAYIDGDDQAGGRICQSLESVVRTEVRRFLSDGDTDHDDVVQETLLGLLAYLRKTGRGPDRIEAFAVTMAGNRCRNLFRWRRRRPTVDLESASEWLRATGRDPLEELEASERERLVREALAQLDAPCRRMLTDIYVEQRSMQEIQKEVRLGTVQGVYYRKHGCLRKLALLLNRVWLESQESKQRTDVRRRGPHEG
jgi:RNA polymerase sigma factor (sigma-70 family)